MNLDLYWFGVDNAVATFNGTSGREQRQTLGGRTWGMIGQTNLDFEVEGAGQFGSVGRGSIAAWMFTAVLGYTLPVPRWAPRVYLEFDYASGDPTPGGNVGTFNQLFPDAHHFLGYIDYIGRQNIISASGGLAMTPVRDLTLSLQQYFFWRASDRDALYNKTGAVLRPGNGNHRPLRRRRGRSARDLQRDASCAVLRGLQPFLPRRVHSEDGAVQGQRFPVWGDSVHVLSPRLGASGYVTSGPSQPGLVFAPGTLSGLLGIGSER